jgi:MoaA/NifB/PqqE/SkfB family radical SAM enzyme
MLPINGFHIEPTNLCTLKCPGCARTRFIEQWPTHWKNQNLSVDDLLRFLDINIQNLKIHFSGNYGDPIYHPDFLSMVDKVKQRGAKVLITTNGSYKKRDWWEKICGLLEHGDSIRFSIDGIPEDFTKYRINADWQSIRDGIETCVKKDIDTIWKFIPFSFNVDEIDQAKSLATSMGIKNFTVDPSDRYDHKTLQFMPPDKFIGPRKTSRDRNIKGIDPKCFKGHEHFITAAGYYSPCCYIADHRFYYKTPFGKNQKIYDIRHTTFSQLMQDSSLTGFFDKFQTDIPSVCQFNCPKKVVDQ